MNEDIGVSRKQLYCFLFVFRKVRYLECYFRNEGGKL